jgi:hypothetical protein
LDRRLGGPQGRCVRDDEEKNSQPLPGLEHPIIQPVAQRYITELSRSGKNKCLKTNRLRRYLDLMRVKKLGNSGYYIAMKFAVLVT